MNDHLKLLKETADKLGISYNANIGATSLEKKIEDYEAELEASGKSIEKVVKALKVPESKPLTPIQVEILRAKNLRKVKIANLDSQNTGSNSVTSGVCNMHFEIQRVIPLGIPCAVEQCLLDEIEGRMHIIGEPEVDRNGNHTGNTRSIAVPTYAVSYLK